MCKKIFIPLMLIFVIVSCGEKEVKPEKKSGKEELVKKSLEKIFECAKNENYEELAKYIIYRGDDETRNWKDYANYNDEFEAKQVRNGCTIIKSYLDESDKYEYGSYYTEVESEGEWNIMKVNFIKEDISKTVEFGMLFIKDEFRLGDIDF